MQVLIGISIFISKVISLSKMNIDFTQSGPKVHNFWYSTGKSEVGVAGLV